MAFLFKICADFVFRAPSILRVNTSSSAVIFCAWKLHLWVWRLSDLKCTANSTLNCRILQNEYDILPDLLYFFNFGLYSRLKKFVWIEENAFLWWHGKQSHYRPGHASMERAFYVINGEPKIRRYTERVILCALHLLVVIGVTMSELPCCLATSTWDSKSQL